MANNSGHFVRFLQRVKTAGIDLGARTYLYLDSGFSIYDRPDDDAIGIAFNPAGLYQTPWKFQVEGRATSNVNTASPSTIGGVALVDGVRYGLFGQSDAKQNGIYYYDSDTNTLIRTSDADESTDILGAVVMCRKGTGAGEMWYCSNTGTAIPGSDNINFALRQSSGDKAKLDGIAVGAQVVTWPNIVSAGAAAAVDLDINGVEVKNAKDPTTAQSLVTRAYYAANLPSGGVSDVVGTSPIAVTGTTTKTVSINSASVCTWPNIVTAGATAAADLAINGRSITSCTAVGSAGALALSAASGAASIDASAAVNIAGTNAASCNIGHDTITTTITGLQDGVYSGFTTTATTGRKLRNGSAASAINTVRYSPSDELEGRAWISSTNKALRMRRTGRPRTSSNWDDVWEYDTGSGSYSEAFRWTSSTAGQFVAAFQSHAFACGGGGMFYDAVGSGMFFGGSGQLQLKNYDSGNPWLAYSDGGFSVQTGGANLRISLDTSGRGYYIAKAVKPTSSGNAVTITLSSQYAQHTVTEATTVTWAGLIPGMSGKIEFIQGAGFTVTLPDRGAALEYDAAIYALGLTSIVDAGTSKRTILTYLVTDLPATRLLIIGRSVITIP